MVRFASRTEAMRPADGRRGRAGAINLNAISAGVVLGFGNDFNFFCAFFNLGRALRPEPLAPWSASPVHGPTGG